LVGFVYVKSPSNPSPAQPDVIVTPASTPPQYYDVPTVGTLTLIVESGKFMIKPTGTANNQIFTKDLADGNGVIVTVATNGVSKVTVAGSGIAATGAPKLLAMYEESLADGYPSGTTKNMSSPGNPDTRQPNRNSISSLAFSLDGKQTASPTNSIMAGEKRYLGIAVLDSQGISVPGIATFGGANLQSSGAQIAVDSSQNLIIPAFQGQLPATVTVTASISSVNGAVEFDYSYGPATAVTMSKDAQGTAITSPLPIRWQVTSNPVDPFAVTTAKIFATVTNKYGAAIPNVVIDWSNVKAPSNVWQTSSAGPCFVDPVDETTPMAQTTTDINGRTSILISAPIAADGPLGGTASPPVGPPGSGDQRPKGLNHVFATVNGSSPEVKNLDPAQFRVTRDMKSIKIREKDTMSQMILDIRSTYTYHAYGTDVDDVHTDDPPGAVWSLKNIVGNEFIGNSGDDFRTDVPKGHFDTQTTSQAQMSNGIVLTGKLPGQCTISLTYPGLAADTYSLDIYGEPVKIYFLAAMPTWTDTNFWEEGQVTYRPSPDNSLQGDIGGQPGSDWIPDGNTPPIYHIYLYMFLMDSWGHILPRSNTRPIDTTDPFDSTAVLIDPISPFNGTVTKIAAPAGSPGIPVYDVNPGGGMATRWGIHFDVAGTYVGFSGALNLPISVKSIIPDGRGGFLTGRRIGVQN